MNDPTETLGNGVRVLMSKLAVTLNKLFRGKLKPSHITVLSLLGHVPAAWALWNGKTTLAIIFIIVFGLMDALDGALARVQKSATRLGMLFDSVSDRLKETLLYAALAVFVSNNYPEVGVWVVPAVVGTSIFVSYVRARGETALTNKSEEQLNKVFTSGIARYEIRMSLLIIGLISGFLPSMLNLIIALNLATASLRFMEVARLLSIEDNANKKTPSKKK